MVLKKQSFSSPLVFLLLFLLTLKSEACPEETLIRSSPNPQHQLPTGTPTTVPLSSMNATMTNSSSALPIPPPSLGPSPTPVPSVNVVMMSSSPVRPSPPPSLGPSPTPLPSICQPATLDPAIECGCLNYYEYYSGREEFQVLERACLDELGNNLSNGYLACQETDFVTPIGRLRPDVIDQFFLDAKNICVDPGARYPTRQVSMVASGTTTYKFRQGTTMHSSTLDSITPPVIRIPYQIAHKKLVNFCLVVLSTSPGKSRGEIYCDCCPRHSQCRN